MERKAASKNAWLAAVALTFLSAVLHSPLLFFDRAFVNEDFLVHYGWARQFAEAFQEGEFYPRWMSRSNQGLGEPAFLYYPPLFHMTVAVLSPLAGGHWPAMKLTAVLTTALAGLAGYCLVRHWVSPGWALLAGVLLETIPLMGMVLIRLNGWPWYASLPLLIALLGVTLRPRPAAWGIDPRIAAVTGLLVATHVLSALMALICVPILPAYRAFQHTKSGKRALGAAAAWCAAAGLGLAAAAAYLLPALSYLDWVTPGGWSTAVWLDWRNSFAMPAVTAWLYGVRWATYQWYVPVVTMLPVIAATIAVARGWMRQDGPRRAAVGLLMVAWVSVFFASELSYPVWRFLKPVQMVQFPTRFLSIAGAAGLLANLLCLAGVQQRKRALLLLAPLAASFASYLFIETYSFSRLAAPLPAELADRGTYEGRPEYQPATLGPNWRAYAQRGGLERECREADGICRQIRNRVHEKAWEVDIPRRAVLRLPLLAFPAWRISVDGQPVPLRADDLTGLIVAELEPGRHRLEVRWSTPAAGKVGWVLSLGAWLTIAGLWWRRRRGRTA